VKTIAIRQGDLAKIGDLITLLDQWKADAAALGITLQSVIVQPNQYNSNTIWYNEDQTGGSNSFWQID
jgi:hypothetical protein